MSYNDCIKFDNKLVYCQQILKDKNILTVILSNGYGTRNFEQPIYKQFKSILDSFGLNWITYVYPERNIDAIDNILLISNGIYTFGKCQQKCRDF
jgi:hypothetical protein